MIRCSTCKEILPEYRFYRNRARANGRANACIDCHKEHQRKYEENNPYSSREVKRRAHRKHRASLTEDQRREKDRNRALSRRGLSPAEFNQMLERQDGGCAVCRVTPRGNLHVDHNHKTGKVRGLLCTSCNNGIGRFRDNPELLEKAAEYLETWRMKNA